MKRRSYLFRIFGTLLALCGPAAATTYSGTYSTGTEVPVSSNGFTATGHDLALTLGYAPPVGTQLTVVENTGLDFIAGAFTGVAHGQQVTLSHGGKTYYFVADYYGGTGNDLVLHWEGTRPVAWGENGTGNLGDNSTVDKTTPVNVLNTGVLAGRTVLSVASGGNHNLALCDDGRVYSWGRGASGELGTGGTATSLVPVAVSTASGSSSLFGKTVVAVDAGMYYSLALCSDGTVHAWGYNASGQLGNNSASNTNSSYPVAVNTTSGVSALFGKTVVGIAAGCGGYHSLARCSDGTLVAWGRNTAGCLGDASATTRKVPVAVSTAGILSGRTVTGITAGLDFSVALCSDGTVATWGDNGLYQLGDGLTTDRNTPGAITTTTVQPSGSFFISVSAGDSHAVALRNDGVLVTWGSNTYFQRQVTSTQPSLLPYPTYPLSGGTVAALSAGQHYTLALCQDGKVAAWGRNNLRQLGDGSTVANTDIRVDMVTMDSFKSGQRFAAVSSGLNHAVGLIASPHEMLDVEDVTDRLSLTDGGSTVDFGLRSADTPRTFTLRNTGTTTLSGLAVTVDGAQPYNFDLTTTGMATTLAPGASTSFTVTFNPGYSNADLHIASSLPGSLSSFDIALTGRGTGSLYPIFYQPTDVPVTASSVAVGGSITINLSLTDPLAVGTELKVINNTGRNLITGSFVNLVQGQELFLKEDGIHYLFIVDYYGGDGNDLVLRWHGARPYGWGGNTYATIGDGTGTSRLLPTATDVSGVLAGKTVICVNSANLHSAALCSDGTVATWGDNSYSQLGDNTVIGRLTPVLVHRTSGPLLNRTVVAIATGDQHTLALCSDGTLVAWGDNAFGQLGDNTLVNKKIPTLVNTGASSALNGKTVVRISAGYQSSQALCSDGTLVAWGFSYNGMLGIGYDAAAVTAFKLPVRVDVSGDSALSGKSIIDVRAGGYHGLAQTTDGTLASWGDDTQGALGNGSLVYGFTPGRINTESGVSALSGKTVTRLNAGFFSNIALAADGTVYTWGANNWGQLGDNTFTDREVPVAVDTTAGISALHGQTVVKASMMGGSAMALCSDGTLAMWGYGSFGALGNGGTAHSKVPVFVDMSTLGPDDRFCDIIHNSGGTSLALVASPQALTTLVYVSNGTTYPDNSYIDFGPLYKDTGTTAYVSSRQKTFYLDSFGTLPLDNVNVSITGTYAAQFSVTPVTLDGLGRHTFTVTYAPTVTGQHGSTKLVITSNASGSQGVYEVSLYGETTTTTLDAEYDDGTESAVTVAAFTATNKTLRQPILRYPPNPGTQLMVVNITGGKPVTDTFLSLPHGATVGVKHGFLYYDYVINYFGGDGNDIVLVWKNNRPLTWGENNRYQLGNGTSTDRAVAWPMKSETGALAGRTILSTATGGGHTLVLCDDGKVYAWGDNQYGQLGDNTTVDKYAPVAVNTTTGVSALYNKRVLAIAAGKHHSMALYLETAPNPDIYCVATWGRNDSGQLGDNTSTDKSVPVNVYAAGSSALYNSTATTKESVYAIAAGDFHSMALYLDTSPATDIVTVATWGLNNNRQLGHNNAAASSDIPVTVFTGAGSAFATLKNATAIAAGANHGLAIRSDGAAVAWGLNDQGQVGNNSLTTPAYPVAVDTATAPLYGKAVAAITAGTDHSLALCTDGTLAAWGNADDGQLGYGGTTDYSNTPATVYAGSGSSLENRVVKKISASGNRCYALCTDASVAAWGGNDDGRLGDNGWVVDGFGVYSYADQPTPVLLSRTAVPATDIFSDLSKGPCASHGLITVGESTSASQQFVIAIGDYILDNGTDVIAIGSTGPGSAYATPLWGSLITTGLSPLSSGFHLYLDDDGPNDVFQTDNPTPSISSGTSTPLRLYRDPAYPGDHDGLLRVTYPGLTTFEADLDGY